MKVLRTAILILLLTGTGMAMGKTPALSSSGVPEPVAQELAAIYAAAAARLKAIILSPPPGLAAASLEARQARAAMLIRQVEQLRRQLVAESGLWVGENVPQAYRDGLERGAQQAVDAGVRPAPTTTGLSGSFSQVNHRAVLLIAQDTIHDLSRAADAMTARGERLLRATAQRGLSEQTINRVIATGIIEGQPRHTIAELQKELIAVHGETVPLIDKNGDLLNLPAGYYASMVVRTRTREAVEKARHQQLRDSGLDLVAIIGRVSKNFCTAFLGEVFSLSGKDDKYPALAELPGGGPPFHPNCSKSTRPFIAHLATPAELKLADGLADARKLLGMNQSRAQRTFKDLQLFQQQAKRYPPMVKKALAKGGGANAA